MWEMCVSSNFSYTLWRPRPEVVAGASTSGEYHEPPMTGCC